MKQFILLFLTIALFTACEEKSDLEAEVIAIHDEVMPKMGAMHLARKNLREVMKSTEDEAIKSEILTMISDLENADEGMMTWMHEWKVPENEPEKRVYLLKEKEKITKVKHDMLSSLEKANNFIEKSKLK